MSAALLFPVTFVGGADGTWNVAGIVAITGDSLPSTPMLAIHAGDQRDEVGAWTLRGVAEHVRYTERSEKEQLTPVSPSLGRVEASRAVLIAIRKSPDWWALPQDERRAIFETRSQHVSNSMPYLPRIARRLYHSRDLSEPFDFLTWFEFASEHTDAFDELLQTLRSREEWTFVDREVEVRLAR